MKTKLVLLMWLAASALNAQNKLTLVIDGIDEVKGHLMIAVLDNEKKPVTGKIVKVEAETATVVFDSIPSGEYAVSIYQDENDNKKLDTGAFGIPTEKFGNSNNVRAKMGPPDFKEQLFRIEEDTEIAITLMQFKL
jgi:uncharacterized protein (DUF2141 family)